MESVLSELRLFLAGLAVEGLGVVIAVLVSPLVGILILGAGALATWVGYLLARPWLPF